MNQSASSYRRILKSSSIIGGASFVNILIGLVRTKVLALLLGPMGVGITGLYRGLMSTASTIATMGLDTVGTRQIAEAIGKEDERALYVARRALFWGTMILACAGAFAVWCLRGILAARVLGRVSQGAIVGWLSLGVALTVASTSQGALIQGMRRIRDLAALNVFGALLNTIVGVALLWRWGKAGLVFYVLVVPLASFALGHLYVSRLPKLRNYEISFHEMVAQWNDLLRLGAAFMGAALAASLVQLWIRVDIGNTLGPVVLGHFQASWTISTQYIVLALGAMGADYYPRLTGVIHDHTAAVKLVNEQTEIALLLSAPILLAMMALAPWVLKLLYTSAFAPAAGILRWKILSDVLKVASWPLGFVILAVGDGRTFFFTETISLLLLGGVITGLLRTVGPEIAGISFLASYIFYLPMVYWLAKSRIGFKWSVSVVRLLTVIFALCACVGVLASVTPWGSLLGAALSIVFGVFALGRLSHISEVNGPVGRMGAMARRLTTRATQV